MMLGGVHLPMLAVNTQAGSGPQGLAKAKEQLLPSAARQKSDSANILLVSGEISVALPTS